MPGDTKVDGISSGSGTVVGAPHGAESAAGSVAADIKPNPVDPTQAAPRPPREGLISSPDARLDPLAPTGVRIVPEVRIPELVLTDKQKEKFYTGRIRHVEEVNIGSPQHLELLERHLPSTAKNLVRCWAETADVFWEIVFNLRAQGVGPENPGFKTAVDAAFNQRTAASETRPQGFTDDGARAFDTKRAVALAFYQKDTDYKQLYRPFVSRVLPQLYEKMNEHNIALVDRLTAEYGIQIARQDDVYKALVGFAVVAESGELDGLLLSAAERELVERDGFALRGALGYGWGSWRASFDVKNAEARDRAVAISFGEILVGAGIKPHGLKLEI